MCVLCGDRENTYVHYWILGGNIVRESVKHAILLLANVATYVLTSRSVYNTFMTECVFVVS